MTRATAEPSPGTTSLAVLPLDNLSADPNQDYFADGTTEALARRPRPAPSSLVRVAVGLGDTDAAFLALDQAFEGRSGLIASLKVSPFLDPLRADPRFRDLLRRANLLPPQ